MLKCNSEAILKFKVFNIMLIHSKACLNFIIKFMNATETRLLVDVKAFREAFKKRRRHKFRLDSSFTLRCLDTN